jgi:protein SCO1/2
MPLRKTFVWSLLAAVLLGIAAAILLRPPVPVALRSGTALPQPRPIGEFELVDQRGRALTRGSFEGRWSLVFTGFTNCPDICPTTLALLATLDSRPRERGSELQTVFVSVDPERDTPSQLAQYVGHFDPSMIGATGPKAQIDRLCAELGLAYVLNPGTAGEYTVDHSAALVLVDPKARIAAYFQPPFDPDMLATDLATLAAAQS